MSSQIVLVTGASGFVGSNVLEAVVDAGYTARALVRPSKAASLRAAYADVGDRLEVAEIDDLATSDLDPAFKGVWAVLHVGSPLPGTVDPETSIRSAIDGTKRIIDAAHAAGVKKIVYTSTFANIFDPANTWKDATYNEDDWYKPQREDALKPGLGEWAIYVIGKALAEQQLWKFAEEHKDYDVTAILPSFILGKYGKGQTVNSLVEGTNRFIYGLIVGGPIYDHGDFLPTFVNIKDVAALQILALKTGDVGRQKRILAQGGPMVVRELAEYLHQAHPEIKERISKLEGAGDAGKVGEYAKLEGKNAKAILGYDKFIGLHQTVDETVAALLEKEKELAQAK